MPKPEDTTIRGAKVKPDLSIDFVVEGAGYQMDLYLDDKRDGFRCVYTECRDFGGNPSRKKAIQKLVQELQKAVGRWRSAL